MKKSKIAFYILMFLPLILSCVAFQFLPDRIPAHYGLNGEADRYGSKAEIFVLPVSVIPFGAFLLFMAKLAGKNESNGNTNNVKIAVASGITALAVFNVLTVVSLYTSFKKVENLYAGADINRLLFSLIGVVFIMIGNLMPKLKRNGIVGRRQDGWITTGDKALLQQNNLAFTEWLQ